MISFLRISSFHLKYSMTRPYRTGSNSSTRLERTQCAIYSQTSRKTVERKSIRNSAFIANTSHRDPMGPLLTRCRQPSCVRGLFFVSQWTIEPSFLLNEPTVYDVRVCRMIMEIITKDCIIFTQRKFLFSLSVL